MNVRALQQFLLSLVQPLQASGAGEKPVADLQHVAERLEQFADQPVGVFAEFLARAQGFEREGHWPRQAPAIVGHIVDEPDVAAYAQRLKAFLQREVPERGPMSATVPVEMKRLSGRLKLPQLKELALLLAVPEPGKSGAVILERIFRLLTGREWKPALIECHACRLQALAGAPELENALEEVGRSLTVPEMKKLAAALSVTGKIASRPDAVQRIRAQLAGRDANAQAVGVGPSEAVPPAAPDPRLARCVESLRALKARAEVEPAADEEIEAQLQRLGDEINREDALLIARDFGVAWNVTTKADALDRIRHKVFERRRAQESIQF